MGLGLPMARPIAEAHGGTLTLSGPGIGGKRRPSGWYCMAGRWALHRRVQAGEEVLQDVGGKA